MTKNEFCLRLRAYARTHLSPTPEDRQFISDVYASVCNVIGAANSLQIGSYPRFTAIRPLHDLDVLYILGAWDPAEHNPATALTELEGTLKANYENPTPYAVTIGRQTHSVTIKYLDGDEEVFSVDIVPAYAHGENEFGDDSYVVPEIALESRGRRAAVNEAVARGERAMMWIKSDPRGYITAARNLNEANADFRKAVKVAKGWRAACKVEDPNFALKSFHLEQAITRRSLANPAGDLFDMLFDFFCRLPDYMRYPQIADRADPAKNIDAYVEGLSEAERRTVREARDGFLIRLENFAATDDVVDLIAAPKRKRASAKEAYLFDKGIPMLTERQFSIVAEVQVRDGGFRKYILDKLGIIEVDRKISFRPGADAPAADLFKWKVKNDDASEQPRGEITDHHTANDPEHTKYKGSHYVECFAIRSKVCVGRARQDVVLNSRW